MTVKTVYDCAAKDIKKRAKKPSVDVFSHQMIINCKMKGDVILKKKLGINNSRVAKKGLDIVTSSIKESNKTNCNINNETKPIMSQEKENLIKIIEQSQCQLRMGIPNEVRGSGHGSLINHASVIPVHATQGIDESFKDNEKYKVKILRRINRKKSVNESIQLGPQYSSSSDQKVIGKKYCKLSQRSTSTSYRQIHSSRHMGSNNRDSNEQLQVK